MISGYDAIMQFAATPHRFQIGGQVTPANSMEGQPEPSAATFAEPTVIETLVYRVGRIERLLGLVNGEETARSEVLWARNKVVNNESV